MRAKEFTEGIPALGVAAQRFGKAFQKARKSAMKNPLADNPLVKKNPFSNNTGTQKPQTNLDKAKTAATQELKKNLLKKGTRLPLPTTDPSNKVTDFEVDKVQGDEIVLKNPKPKPGDPVKTTHKIKDLDPAIAGLLGK